VTTVSLILDAIFLMVIALTMVLCQFALIASMTANMLEQSKEIGVIRAMGFTKYRIYILYYYESFIIVFSSCVMGIIIGTILGWTMNLQRVLFTNLPLQFFFPYIQTALVFIISVIFSIFSTLGPAMSILKRPIAQIFRL
jgi:ABC-type antimicrobial peptide transport system permease subunit